MDKSHRPFPGLLAQPFAASLLIAMIATLIYSNTFFASFQFDDAQNIVDNPKIKHLQNLLDFSGSRYVGILSFALNYHFGLLNVLGYHIVNLFIHIANGILVYGLIRLLFQSPRLTPPTAFAPAAPAVALFTALLFVVHPVQTEAVTYIVQRFASLATLFYLLAVVCYLKWRLASRSTLHFRFSISYLWYAAAFLATILAMKTKEITLTMPFMLMLVEFVGFGLPSRKQWIGLIPFFLILPIIPLSRPGALGEGEAGFASDVHSLSRSDYLFTQFHVIMTYLRLLVLPVNQNLDYDYPAAHSLFEPLVFLSFLFLTAFFAAAVCLVFVSRHAAADSRLRLIGFGILWFFLTLSIESSIIPIRDVIFEHRLYLPSVGFWLAVTTALFGFLDRWRTLVAAALAGLIVLFSIAAYQRNGIWKDELSLWSDVVKKSPNKARPHNNLGAAFADQSRWEEALPECEIAIALQPDFVDAHYNMGLIYYKQGKIPDAFGKFETAIKLRPDYAEAHNNLGLVYKALRRPDDAVREYNTALSINPDYAEAHSNLGVIYKDRGNYNEAIQEYNTALSIKPDYAEIHNNLGNVYQKMGRFDEALQEYRNAILIKSDYPSAYFNQGVVYYNQGKMSDAITAFKEAIRLNPDYAEAHNNLGDIYKEQGNFQDAIQEFQTAIKLKPDLVEAYYNLGESYQHAGQIPEAIKAFEQALQIKPDYDKARRALDALHR
jgi:tetratricopeptide (TPR) repeat protein